MTTDMIQQPPMKTLFGLPVQAVTATVRTPPYPQLREWYIEVTFISKSPEQANEMLHQIEQVFAGDNQTDVAFDWNGCRYTGQAYAVSVCLNKRAFGQRQDIVCVLHGCNRPRYLSGPKEKRIA